MTGTPGLLKTISNFNFYLSLIVVLIVANLYIWQTHLAYSDFAQGTYVSVLEMIAPNTVRWLSTDSHFMLLKTLFYLCSLVWAGLILFFPKRQVLLSCIGFTVTFSYLLISSVFWENLAWFRHKYILPFWFLLFFSMFFLEKTHSEGKCKEKSNWPIAYGFIIWGSFYTLSAIAKLWHAPDTWFSGTGLALWFNAFGNPQWNPINHVAFYQTLSIATLLIEFLALPAFLLKNRHLTVAVSFFLVTFHIAVYLIFGIPFFGHALLSALLIFHVISGDFSRSTSIA